VLVAHEDRVTPWLAFGHYGLTHCRIWNRQTPFGMFQAHEWKREDGSTFMEKWITGPRGWSKAAEPSSEAPPSEAEALLSTLRDIAHGHNDPRNLAIETLKALGLE
jgi:hypothetical protein